MVSSDVDDNPSGDDETVVNEARLSRLGAPPSLAANSAVKWLHDGRIEQKKQKCRKRRRSADVDYAPPSSEKAIKKCGRKSWITGLPTLASNIASDPFLSDPTENSNENDAVSNPNPDFDDHVSGADMVASVELQSQAGTSFESIRDIRINECIERVASQSVDLTTSTESSNEQDVADIVVVDGLYCAIGDVQMKAVWNEVKKLGGVPPHLARFLTPEQLVVHPWSLPDGWEFCYLDCPACLKRECNRVACLFLQKLISNNRYWKVKKTCGSWVHYLPCCYCHALIPSCGSHHYNVHVKNCIRLHNAALKDKRRGTISSRPVANTICSERWAEMMNPDATAMSAEQLVSSIRMQASVLGDDIIRKDTVARNIALRKLTGGFCPLLIWRPPAVFDYVKSFWIAENGKVDSAKLDNAIMQRFPNTLYGISDRQWCLLQLKRISPLWEAGDLTLTGYVHHSQSALTMEEIMGYNEAIHHFICNRNSDFRDKLSMNTAQFESHFGITGHQFRARIRDLKMTHNQMLGFYIHDSKLSRQTCEHGYAMETYLLGRKRDAMIVEVPTAAVAVNATAAVTASGSDLPNNLLKVPFDSDVAGFAGSSFSSPVFTDADRRYQLSPSSPVTFSVPRPVVSEWGDVGEIEASLSSAKPVDLQSNDAELSLVRLTTITDLRFEMQQSEV